MKRWLPGGLIAVIGLLFIGGALGARLFTVAPAFERMTGDFRPEMKTMQIAQLRQDLNGLSAVQAEFTTKVTPQLATALHMTPQQFGAAMQQEFPAVTTGMQAVPQITSQFGQVLTVLDNESGRFTQADAIPTKSVPATTMPWLFVGIGLLSLGAAFLAPRRRGGAAALGLGLVVVVSALALSMPSKAAAADTMNSHLRPVYNAQLVTGAKQSMATMTAMGSQMQSQMLPALAGALKMTPAQVQSYLGTNFPATAAGLASLPAALGRFNAMVHAFDHSLGNYNTIKSTSFKPIVWFLMAAGALMALLGVWSLEREAFPTTSTRHIRRPGSHTARPASAH